MTGGADGGACLDVAAVVDSGWAPGWPFGDPGNALSPSIKTRARPRTPNPNLWKPTDGNMLSPPGGCGTLIRYPLQQQELSVEFQTIQQ